MECSALHIPLPDCANYKPSTSFLKIGFKINVVSPKEGQGHYLRGAASRWSSTEAVTRISTTAHRPWTQSKVPEGMLQDSRGSAVEPMLLSCHHHCHQKGQWKLKRNAALHRQRKELEFWDAPRIPWHLPLNGLRVTGGCPTTM